MCHFLCNTSLFNSISHIPPPVTHVLQLKYSVVYIYCQL
nr:MAG TPA: hypothetical protein [Caudoviricetes sp.]